MISKLFDDGARAVHSAPLEDQPVPVLTLDPKDPRIKQAKEEESLEPYTVSK